MLLLHDYNNVNLVSDNDIRLVLMTVHLELGDRFFVLFWMFLLVVLRNGERMGNLSSMVSGLKQKKAEFQPRVLVLGCVVRRIIVGN